MEAAINALIRLWECLFCLFQLTAPNTIPDTIQVTITLFIEIHQQILNLDACVFTLVFRVGSRAVEILGILILKIAGLLPFPTLQASYHEFSEAVSCDSLRTTFSSLSAP